MHAAQDSYEDLYESAPCGYLSTDPAGRIIRLNATLAAWLGCRKEDAIGRRLSDLLNIAGRIFYETHVAPLLRMQGFFHEFALDLTLAEGLSLPVIANAIEVRGDGDILLSTRFAFFKAVDRRRYERELLRTKAEADRLQKEAQALYNSVATDLKSEREIADVREQFIAVLGHDLRNPLASLSAGARLMLSAKSPSDAARFEKMMQGAIDRMAKMIDSIMDFARGRLGGGLTLSDLRQVDLVPVLNQVTDELAVDHPETTIEREFVCNQHVKCDKDRISQLVSNLIGNAITHGQIGKPVRVSAATYSSSFVLSVANAGAKIPDEILDNLFQPFYRGKAQPSKEGLGLGLYIASEIAKAHKGWLDVISDETETRFTLVMPID